MLKLVGKNLILQFYARKVSLSDGPMNSLRLSHISKCVHRGSYMSAHVLLNLLNELGKSD